MSPFLPALQGILFIGLRFVCDSIYINPRLYITAEPAISTGNEGGIDGKRGLFPIDFHSWEMTGDIYLVVFCPKEKKEHEPSAGA